MINAACAQSKFPDLKSGKYFPNKYKNDIKGVWKSLSSDFEIELDIQVKKTHIEGAGDISFFTEMIIVKIKNYTYKGKNITSQITELIEFVPTGEDRTSFTSRYTDPITKNYVYITINYIDKQTIQFRAKMPEMGLGNDRKKGTVFPLAPITLTK